MSDGLLTALGGLLIAGIITALPQTDPAGGLTANSISLGSRGNDTFDHAKSGDCLNWPERTPDAAQVVDCTAEHRFEVAESVDMSTFPGSEYGPDAEPPSPARIQQISQEQCTAAVRRYLGAKFDPNSKFTISMLWSGDKAWKQSGELRMLCGLQLPGPNNQQLAFTGKVADIDQSKVWTPGTCLGIDPSTNQPTDIPVDCAAPHAMEVTGSVNLAEKFPGGLPAEPDQDAFIKDSCTKLTDAYLAPIQLRNTTLTLIYSTISLPSWSAGSRQVSCSIGATLGNGGWSTLLNSAKGPLMINGQPPVPPPDIPEERLNLPPIDVPQVPVKNIVVEPDGRNSGPAIALAAAIIEQLDAEAIMGSFAADHLISYGDPFRAAIRNAIDVAQTGRMVTVGVTPTRPETGYGYIEAGGPLGVGEALDVVRFKEKPDAATAEEYVASGRFFWNAGMFVWRVADLMEQLRRQAPEIASRVQQVADLWSRDYEGALAKLAEGWVDMPSISIDHAVVEGAAAQGKLATVPVDMGWSDIGDWDTIAEIGNTEGSRLAQPDETLLIDSPRSFATSATGRAVTVVGVPDVVVVETEAAILVVKRDQAQRVKDAVDEWKARGRDDLL